LICIWVPNKKVGQEPLIEEKKNIYMRVGSLIDDGVLFCYVALFGLYTSYDMVINIHV
jgi:hypothetical protein